MRDTNHSNDNNEYIDHADYTLTLNPCTLGTGGERHSNRNVHVNWQKLDHGRGRSNVILDSIMSRDMGGGRESIES